MSNLTATAKSFSRKKMKQRFLFSWLSVDCWYYKVEESIQVYLTLAVGCAIMKERPLEDKIQKIVNNISYGRGIDYKDEIDHPT